MRRLLVPIVLFAAVAFFSQASAARRQCSLHRGDTVIQRTAAAVITARPNDKGDRTFSGCLRATGRWRTLFAGNWDGYGGRVPDLAALGGRFAAVVIFTGDHYGGGLTTIDVIDLRSGRRHRPVRAGHSDGDPGIHQFSVWAVAVSRYGTLGWLADHIYAPTPGPPDTRTTASAHDAGGTRVVDSDTRGGLTDLAFRGRRLVWSHDGTPRSVILRAR